MGDDRGAPDRRPGSGAAGRRRAPSRRSHRVRPLPVIGVLGGLVAAVMWGTSTLAASRSTRMIGAQQALAYVLLTGLAISLVAAPLVDGVPHSNAAGWAWAVLGGVASVA